MQSQPTVEGTGKINAYQKQQLKLLLKKEHRQKRNNLVVLDQLPSEHGEHMVMLKFNNQKKGGRRASQISSFPSQKQQDDPAEDQGELQPTPLLRQEIKKERDKARPHNNHDFALNTQINCEGDISPNVILESQMPWRVDEDEKILQNQYKPQVRNLESELRTLKVAEKRERQSKERISKLKKQLEKQRELSVSQQSISMMMDTLSKPVKVAEVGQDVSVLSLHKTEDDSIALPEIDQVARMSNFKLFGEPTEKKEFKYGSPSKSPLKKNIANPEYRPFEANGSEMSSSYSNQFSSSEDNKSMKSEDDSPHRRKLIRSPKKKNAALVMQELDNHDKMKQLLLESDQVDAKLKQQLQFIREVRQKAQDVISNSESVVNKFNSAQQEMQERIQSKKFEHLGNENFMKGLILKDLKRKRDSLEVVAPSKGQDLWKNLKLKIKSVKKVSDEESKHLISEDRLRKEYQQKIKEKYQSNQPQIKVDTAPNAETSITVETPKGHQPKMPMDTSTKKPPISNPVMRSNLVHSRFNSVEKARPSITLKQSSSAVKNADTISLGQSEKKSQVKKKGSKFEKKRRGSQISNGQQFETIKAKKNLKVDQVIKEEQTERAASPCKIEEEGENTKVVLRRRHKHKVSTIQTPKKKRQPRENQLRASPIKLPSKLSKVTSTIDVKLGANSNFVLQDRNQSSLLIKQSRNSMAKLPKQDSASSIKSGLNGSARIVKQSKHNRFKSIDRSIKFTRGVLHAKEQSPEKVACPGFVGDENSPDVIPHQTTMSVTLSKNPYSLKHQQRNPERSEILCEENPDSSSQLLQRQQFATINPEGGRYKLDDLIYQTPETTQKFMNLQKIHNTATCKPFAQATVEHVEQRPQQANIYSCNNSARKGMYHANSIDADSFRVVLDPTKMTKLSQKLMQIQSIKYQDESPSHEGKKQDNLSLSTALLNRNRVNQNFKAKAAAFFSKKIQKDENNPPLGSFVTPSNATIKPVLGAKGGTKKYSLLQGNADSITIAPSKPLMPTQKSVAIISGPQPPPQQLNREKRMKLQSLVSLGHQDRNMGLEHRQLLPDIIPHQSSMPKGAFLTSQKQITTIKSLKGNFKSFGQDQRSSVDLASRFLKKEF